MTCFGWFLQIARNAFLAKMHIPRNGFSAKMHIPRYRRFAHCAQCCFGQNAYTALWAALRIARNAHLTDCAQCVLAILVLSAHMARYMQNRELPRARDAQAKILQCCVLVPRKDITW